MQTLESFTEYDIENGGFIVTKKRNKHNAKLPGNPAATRVVIKGKPARADIFLDGRPHSEHKLVWFWFTGCYISAPLLIDHKNQDPFCNRVQNLRAATVQQNTHNKVMYSTNTSGITNINFDSRLQKYKVQIRFNKQDYYGGIHNTIEGALIARDALRAKLNNLGASFTDLHGEPR